MARVLRALCEQAVHPTEFERCACALLQSQYPGLSAIEGGHDFGRHADIYFPWGSEDVNARGHLLVATGDPVANLRTGLRRMREERARRSGGDGLLATVDATKRATMVRLCTERSLPAPHIYGCDWFVVRRVRPSRRRLKKLTDFEKKTGSRYSVAATNIRHTWGIAGSHQIQFLDALHPDHAEVEDRVRTNKAMGLRNLPSHSPGRSTRNGCSPRTSRSISTPGSVC